MKLTILDRFMLLQILPPEGDLRTMKVVHALRMDLALTAAEIEAWEVKDVPAAEGRSSVVWNETKVEEVEIDVAGVKTEILVEALRKLDKDKKLGVQHLSICEKFPMEAKT